MEDAGACFKGFAEGLAFVAAEAVVEVEVVAAGGFGAEVVVVVLVDFALIYVLTLVIVFCVRFVLAEVCEDEQNSPSAFPSESVCYDRCNY